jgi:hypothetical protein
MAGDSLDYLLSPAAIRDRSRLIFEAAKDGGTHFEYRAEKLREVVDFVAEVTRENYPDLKIPFHSRWSHFKVGGVDRLARLREALKGLAKEERARTLLDLVIASVLLDAGAGMAWKYTENGKTYGKSEGLAVASLAMFMAGAFSHDPKRPHQVTSEGLARLDAATLERGFQVSAQALAGDLVGAFRIVREGAGHEHRQARDREAFGFSVGLAVLRVLPRHAGARIEQDRGND